MPTHAVSSAWLAPLVKAIESYGINASELLASELENQDFNAPANASISFEAMSRLWQRASALTKDPALGLTAARFASPNSFGPVSMAMSASKNPMVALKTLAEFSGIGSSAATFHYRENSQYFELMRQGRSGGAGADELKDAVMAFTLSICQSLGNPTLKPKRLIIGRRPPKDPSKWRAFFGVMPEFHANGPSLIRFAISDTVEKCPFYEPEVYDLCVSLLSRKLKELHENSFVALVRTQIMAAIEDGEIHIDQIAEKLSISRRTLQRRLWDQCQLTFGELVQSIRHAMAKRYLANSEKSVEEISFLLGYSSASSFSRNFRSNFDITPSEYRRNTSTIDVDLSAEFLDRKPATRSPEEPH